MTSKEYLRSRIEADSRNLDDIERLGWDESSSRQIVEHCAVRLIEAEDMLDPADTQMITLRLLCDAKINLRIAVRLLKKWSKP